MNHYGRYTNIQRHILQYEINKQKTTPSNILIHTWKQKKKQIKTDSRDQARCRNNSLTKVKSEIGMYLCSYKDDNQK